jgi:hypothetical protein
MDMCEISQLPVVCADRVIGGLVRHYSWRTPLCSKKCVDRFRARRQSDRNWVGWLQIAFDQPPENRARAL